MSLFTFTPDMPNDPLRRFRTVAEYITGRNHQSPLKSILAIGAVHDNGDLSLRDQGWLAHTLTLCNDRRISVAQDFHLTVMNLKYGDDFLAPKQRVRADLVMICHLVNPDSRKARYIDHLFQEDPGYFTSPHHSDENWNRAIARAGAKLVVAFNKSGLEVSCRNLSPPDFYYTPSLTVQAFSPNDGCQIAYTMDAQIHRDLTPPARKDGRFHFASVLQRARSLLSL